MDPSQSRRGFSMTMSRFPIMYTSY
jgi:hypothetical protein